jgi:succinate dehydrogenase flavin-adding protein (antitoxin of CptAB toxin-antitoxin module)
VNINDTHINIPKIFFLYGNYKKTFGAFCDFIIEKFRKKFQLSAGDIDIFYMSVAECVGTVNSQCDLFGTKISFFCLRNIEDNHEGKLSPFFGTPNNIFILESGDYMKCKKITENFAKNPNIISIPSFKNDITLNSFCKMLLPKLSATMYREIIRIINETDEDLSSLFKKISLLTENQGEEILKEYATFKQHSFLYDFDLIPLVRYLSKLSIKEKLGGKKQNFPNTDLLKKNLIEKLITAEIKQKTVAAFPKCYIYRTVSQQCDGELPIGRR